MRRALPALPVLLAAAILTPGAAAAGEGGIEIPAARIGDRWRVTVLGDAYELSIEERTTALDRWGRSLDAFAVRVDGFHPLELESKDVTRHTMYLDAASGTQVADVAEYVFGGSGGVTSQPAAYSAYETNDPDGWPGWVQSGGLLAGRTLTPSDVVEVPFVMTNASGAGTIALAIEEAAPEGAARCARATGETFFPSFTYWNTDGYQRSSLTVGLDITACDDAPYARRTEVTYSGAFNHSVAFAIEWFTPGSGEAAGAEAYEQPGHQVTGAAVPFGGRLRDGGAVSVPSVEDAQDAAALAPGLAAWRLTNPAGYLVEAELLLGGYQGLPPEADRWRLVYAAPGGAAHSVEVAMRGPVPVAVDVPVAEAYPAAVPSLASWPAEIASLAGVVESWRRIAGPGARLEGLRWQPVLDDHWYVIGGVGITCDGAPCGDLYGEIAIEVATGALGTGEHPLPAS